MSHTGPAQAPRLARERDGLAVAIALLVLVLTLSGLLRHADDALYDFGLTLGATPPDAAPDDIVIVAIDEPSLAAIGRWPWSRSLHARLLDRLAGAGARAVLLDLVLSEPADDPADDLTLAAALATALDLGTGVVLPVVPAADSGAALTELRPAASLGNAYHLGHADAELDPDGLLRRSYLRAGVGSPRHPHAALALLDAAHASVRLASTVRRPSASGFDAQAAAAPWLANGSWQRDDEVLLRYHGGAGHYRRVSYADLLLGRVPAAALRDKFVLVGVTAAGLGDGYPTPLSGNGATMPSVEIIATLLDTIRRGDAPWSPPEPFGAVISALFAALFVITLTRIAPRQALLLGFGGALGAIVGAWLLLALADLWLAPSGIVLAAMLAGPLWSWRRLDAATRFVDEELLALARRAGPDLGLAAGLRAATPGTIDRRPLETRLDALAGASQHLRDGREFLAEAFAALPEAVFVVDPEGLVLIANPPAARLVAALADDGAGGAATAAPGSPTLPTLPGRRLPQLLTALDLVGDDDWSGTLRRVRDDAQARVVIAMHRQLTPRRVHISPLGSTGQAPDALVVFIAEAVAAPTTPPPPTVAPVQATIATAAVPAPAAVTHQARKVVPTLGDDFVQAMRLESGAAVSVGFDLAAMLADALAEVRALPGGERLPPCATMSAAPRGAPDAALRADEPADQTAEARADRPVPTTAPTRGDPALIRRALADIAAQAIRPASATGPGPAPSAHADVPIHVSLAHSADGNWQIDFAPVASTAPSSFVERVLQHHGGSLSLEADEADAAGNAARYRLTVRLPGT